MFRNILCTVLFYSVLFTSYSASAAIINLTSTITGDQADAGNGTGSTGTGEGTMTFDDVSKELSWEISWTGLVDENAAHFHGPALPNQNAGVQVNIGVAANPAIGSAILDDAQASDLLDGLWYINIHTDAFPSGEIRGQVTVVPIPAAVWLFGSGLILLIGLGRNKS